MAVDPELATAQYLPESADDADSTFVGTSPDDRCARFVEGQVIAGRYTLLEAIGQGGMGSVYRASQSQPVKRQVALKLIKTGLKSRDVLARFDAERQALAMMDHPNIARIYDGGVTEAGQPFFVMELVDGVPLTEYCDRKRMVIKDRLELFVAVCHAVQHAHQKGIIHRDLRGEAVLPESQGGDRRMRGPESRKRKLPQSTGPIEPTAEQTLSGDRQSQRQALSRCANLF